MTSARREGGSTGQREDIDGTVGTHYANSARAGEEKILQI